MNDGHVPPPPGDPEMRRDPGLAPALLALAVAALALAWVVLAGCTPQQRSMTYFRDERTGLCFASTGLGNESTMACVPCTPEVVALIEGQR